MGAADVVPGVSGGTIAFITGIYEELINTIKSVNLNTIKLLLQFKLKDFWKAVNGNFLLALLSGIGFSFYTLAKLVKHLLETQPILIWSFFFGLIVASAICGCPQNYRVESQNHNCHDYRYCYSFYDYRNNTSRSSNQLLVFISIWRVGNLCNDSSGNLRCIYPGFVGIIQSYFKRIK